MRDKILIEKFADNGEHSHYEIINKDGSESDLVVIDKERLQKLILKLSRNPKTHQLCDEIDKIINESGIMR